MTKKYLLTRAKKNQALSLFQANQFHEAKNHYESVLRLDARDAESWFMLGLVNEKLGSMADAETCFRRAADIQPTRPEIQFNLAKTLEAQDRQAEALDCYRNALKIKPDFAAAYVNMGTIHEAQNNSEEAIACYREAIRLAPSAEAHNNLGVILNKLGRLEEAAGHYETALRLGPSAKIYFDLGNIYRRQAKPRQAAACYYQALDRDPQDPETHNNLGIALKMLGRLDGALESFREALRLKPNFVEALCNVGVSLMERGLPDEAMVSFRRALELDPSSINARVGEVRIFERQRNFEQAYARLQPLLDNGKDDLDVALAFAAVCRHVKRCGDAITMLERVLERQTPPLDISERSLVHFELGRLLDAAAEYDRAFDHYRQGNAIMSEPFSTEKLSRQIDDLIVFYNPDFMARAPRASNASPRPLFILGMPRSGTSLVEQILASHPQVAAGGELDDIGHLVTDLPEFLGTTLPYPQCLSALTAESCERLSQRYIEHLAAISADAQRVTDKMPVNFLHLGLITLLFPGARVIHCVRDPMDTCLSCYFQRFDGYYPYAFDLGHLGSYYREYQRLMRHWRTVVELPMMEIHYEDLVADQERMSRDLVAFCGLPWDERCLSFHKTERVVATASYDQVRQPLYQRSVGRWQYYQRFLDPLMRGLSGS